MTAMGDDQPRDEGKVRTEELHLPAPSVWPVVLALGVTLLLFGVPTSRAFTVVGALLVAWALWGWIEDLRHA
jgi:hypothetical protein